MVRRAEIEDVGEIIRISENSLGYSPDTDITLRYLRKYKDSDEVFIFVSLNDEGEITGFIHGEYHDNLWFKPYIYVTALAVSGDFKGKGEGKRLLRKMEETAREKDIGEIILHSGEERLGAHDFYKKMGYRNDRVHLRFRKPV